MYLFLSEFPLGLVLFAPLQRREREEGEKTGSGGEGYDGSGKLSEHLSYKSAALLGRAEACNFLSLELF